MAQRYVSSDAPGRALHELEDWVRSQFAAASNAENGQIKINVKIKTDGTKDLEKANEQIQKLREMMQEIGNGKISLDSFKKFSELMGDMKDNGFNMEQFRKTINTVKSIMKEFKVPYDDVIKQGSIINRMFEIKDDLSPLWDKMHTESGELIRDNKLKLDDAKKYLSEYKELVTLQKRAGLMGTKNPKTGQYVRNPDPSTVKLISRYKDVQDYIYGETEQGIKRRGVTQEPSYNPNKFKGDKVISDQVEQAKGRIYDTFLKSTEEELTSYLPKRTTKKKTEVIPEQPTPVNNSTAKQFEETGNAASDAANKIQEYIDKYREAVGGNSANLQNKFQHIVGQFGDAKLSGDIDSVNKILDIFPQLEKLNNANFNDLDLMMFKSMDGFIGGESIRDLMSTIPELHKYLVETDYDFTKATMSAKEFFETRGLPSQEPFLVDALSQLGDEYKKMAYLPNESIDLEFMKDVVQQSDLLTDKQTVAKAYFKEIEDLFTKGLSNDAYEKIYDLGKVINPDYSVTDQELQKAQEILGIRKQINEEASAAQSSAQSFGDNGNSGLLAQEKTLKAVLDTVNSLNEAFLQLQNIFTSVTPESYTQQFESFKVAIEQVNNSLPMLTDSLERLSNISPQINLKLGGSSSPIEKNRLYGIEARNTIQQLQEQKQQLIDFYKDFYHTSDNDVAQLTQVQGTGLIDSNNAMQQFFDMFDAANNKRESLTNRMSQLQSIIETLKSAAEIKGIDISSITSKFEDAGVLIDKTKNILSDKSSNVSNPLGDLGKNVQSIGNASIQLPELFQKLSEGISIKDINVDQLSKQLQSIQESAQNFNGESIQGIVDFFKSINVTTDNIDNINALATSLNVLGKSIGEVSKISGFNEQITPINNLLQNASQVQDINEVVQKIGATSEQDIQQITDAFKQLGDALIGIKDKIPDLSQVGEAIEKNTSIEATFTKLKEALSSINDESVKSVSDLFGNMKITTKNIDNLLNFSAAIETIGTAIKELSQIEGFQDTLSPINDLLKNAEGLKNLQTIVSSSTAKIKAAKQKTTKSEEQKPYTAKDYIADRKGYYENAARRDDKEEYLAEQYLNRSKEYGEMLKEKYRKGMEMSAKELKAFESNIQFRQQYLDRQQKAQQQKITQDKNVVSQYMKETGTSDVVQQAQKQIKLHIDDASVKDEVNTLNDLLDQLNKEVNKVDGSFDSVDGPPQEVRTRIDAIRQSIKETLSGFKEFDAASKGQMAADRNNLLRQSSNFESWIQRNPQAEKAYPKDVEYIRNQFSRENLSQDGLKELIQYIDEFKIKANQAGDVGKTFSDTLKGSFRNLGRYLMTFASFYRIINTFKQAVNVVKELDTALTEMRKVSNESVSSLKQYQLKTFDMADKVGTTAKQIQNSTADWLRLGKSFKESQELAMQSTVLLNVSEFTDIKDSTEQLVSATQAYDELDATAITDKLNIIGNNFAVGTSELATGLQNAAAVLKTQGNNIDEALALLTAGNLIGQDISKQSAGIRTISLRIAGKLYARTYSNVWA